MNTRYIASFSIPSNADEATANTLTSQSEVPLSLEEICALCRDNGANAKLFPAEGDSEWSCGQVSKDGSWTLS